MKMSWGSGGRATRILYLCFKWRNVVRFTLRPFYSCRRNPLFLLRKRMDGPQKRSERVPAPAGNQNPIFQAVALAVYWLSYGGSSGSVKSEHNAGVISLSSFQSDGDNELLQLCMCKRDTRLGVL